jgi:hypothetical protein
MYISRCVRKHVICELQVKVLKMSSMTFNARLVTSDHGRSQSFKDAGVVTENLDRHPQCDGEVPPRCQREPHTQGISGVSTVKNPEDSNLASMTTMQWVLLYLSVRHDRCY